MPELHKAFGLLSKALFCTRSEVLPANQHDSLLLSGKTSLMPEDQPLIAASLIGATV